MVVLLVEKLGVKPIDEFDNSTELGCAVYSYFQCILDSLASRIIVGDNRDKIRVVVFDDSKEQLDLYENLCWPPVLVRTVCPSLTGGKAAGGRSFSVVGGVPSRKKPVAQKPVAQKPVAQKPVAQKPVAQKPVAQKSVAQKPVAGKLNPRVVVKGVDRLPPTTNLRLSIYTPRSTTGAVAPVAHNSRHGTAKQGSLGASEGESDKYGVSATFGGLTTGVSTTCSLPRIEPMPRR